MKPAPSHPSHRLGWWLAGALVLLLAAGAWPAVRSMRLIRVNLPPVPDLSGASTALADEVATAEAAARAWGYRHDGLARLAGLYHANGFFAEAGACYRILAQLEPREARWPHLIANLEATFGHLDAALPFQREAARLAPDNVIVQLRLGDLLFKANDTAGATQAYARARQLAPKDPYVLLGLARCALRAHDWTAARQLLNEAVAAAPTFTAAWSLLAGVEAHFGDTAASAAAHRRGNGQFRELNDPWLTALNELSYDPYQLSVAAAVAADPAEARALLERAIALAPDVAAYRRQLAKRLITARETAAARSQLEQAVKLAPDDAEAWSALVELLIDTKDMRAAITALAEGLRHCPQSGYLHFTNGRRLAATGQAAQAEAELKLSIQLQPTEIRGYIELSTLYVRAGRIAEAVKLIEGAYAVDPSDLTVMGLLAQLAIMQQDAPAAARWARKVAENPEGADTLARIRAAYRQQFGRELVY